MAEAYQRKTVGEHGASSRSSRLLKIDQVFAKIEASKDPSSADVFSFFEESSLTLRDIVQRILDSVAKEFLLRRSEEELSLIVLRLLTTFVKICREGSFREQGKIGPCEMSIHEEPNALSVCLVDRPFIINTIAEVFRSRGLDIRLLVHPILEHEGTLFSVSYIELNNVEIGRLKDAASPLREALNELMVVTGDFNPMLMRLDSVASSFEKLGPQLIDPNYTSRELGQLIRWLLDDSFIFCGYAQWKISDEKEPLREPETRLGAFDPLLSDRASTLSRECREDVAELIHSGVEVLVRKTQSCSRTVRPLPLNHIVLREPVSDEDQGRIHSIVGLFTSKALRDESRNIPLVRVKLRELIDQERVFDNSYDFSYVVDTINRMPKDLALRLSVPDLTEITNAGIRVYHGSEVQVSCFYEPSRRGAAVVVLLSRDKFNRELKDRIQEYIAQAFNTESTTCEYHLDFSVHPQTRLYFYIPFPRETISEVKTLDLAEAQRRIATFTRTWDDNLREALDALCEEDSGFCPLARFSISFPPEYQATHTVSEAVEAIDVISRLSQQNPLEIRIEEDEERPESSVIGDEATIVLYRLGSEIRVSTSLPVLENIGLETTTSSSFRVQIAGHPPVYIHRLLVRALPRSCAAPEDTSLASVLQNAYFIDGLKEILLGRASSDRLNGLLLSGELSVQAVSLLRAYSLYLWQVSTFATRRSAFDALASSPKASLLLWQLFDNRFNSTLKDGERPLSLEEREHRSHLLYERFLDSLQHVSDITTDRILRSIGDFILHTVRTNFYTGSPALALKLHSEDIDLLPYPKPKFEIYVCAPEFEGVHLRTSMVARGGIRWSERPEDFRTEILGLMKTQKVKNVLIVPSGAKGGFVVRHLPRDYKELQVKVTECYKDFVRAMLSITDNRVDGQIQKPPRVLCYDEDDPYFVVAADKGTATFSDLANKIASEEFNFWLGDAFASGGSNGYDHKKYAITAKGAWECVKRHFSDIGINYLEEPFTVVGIGDMSGDVFGNGMIESRKIKLLAAFNHKHIFIDPDPDPSISFSERKRLFELPRSQWSDYNPELISKGGGVFNRFDKAIRLSQEARDALNISENVETFNGEEVISHILRAKCDLLWNGGIGTYVKASTESHSDVGDSTNDRVRVSATDLRARVVGEGGNLGFTQKARIEYSLRGGSINTDAIDNSAGVDLSDHEVNIKILFSDLIKRSQVTVEERNKLLLEMAPAVVEQVLSHNRSHATMLSLAVQRSLPTLSFFQSLLRNLARMGYLNRAGEVLPDDDLLLERAKQRIGLCRPELAVCLAGVKMWIKDTLVHSDLSNDILLSRYLLNYFPEQLQESFSESISEHPLAKHIIATEVTNIIIDAVGISFVHRMCLNHGVTPVTVIKCTLAAELMLGMESLRAAINVYDNPKDNSFYLELRRELGQSLRNAAAWLLGSHATQLTLREIVDLYCRDYHVLVGDAESVLDDPSTTRYQERLAELKNVGVETDTARQIALLPYLLKVLEVLWAAKQSGESPPLVASVGNVVKEELRFDSLYTMCETLEPESKWEQQALSTSFQGFKRLASLISCRLIEKQRFTQEEILLALEGSYGYEDLVHLLDEIHVAPPSVPALTVLERRLRRFYENML